MGCSVSLSKPASSETMFIVAFTPKPRVVKLRVLPLAKDLPRSGEAMVVATR